MLYGVTQRLELHELGAKALRGYGCIFGLRGWGMLLISSKGSNAW